MAFPLGNNGFQKARILVVDDSAFMRSAIKGMISADPSLLVVDTARDGEEAIEKIARLKPDLVTMDVEMPRMNGLQALQVIMEKMPTPVLMVSSLTLEGAEVTLKALEAGAVDFVCKDLGSRSLDILDIEITLVKKIKEIIQRQVKLKPIIPPSASASPSTVKTGLAFSSSTVTGAKPMMPERKSFERTQNVAIVALGTSAGGPKSLQEVIPYLPASMPVGVLVTQHMPALFTKAFAERLNTLSEINVKEAENGEPIQAGTVYIAKGGVHMIAKRTKPLEVCIELTPHPEDAQYRPSVDVMMHSVVEAYGSRVLGVIMTGMGNDGTDGMKAIKRAGGKTLAQDEASSIVYGMPKAVADAGVVDKIVALSVLANEIVNMV